MKNLFVSILLIILSLLIWECQQSTNSNPTPSCNTDSSFFYPKNAGELIIHWNNGCLFQIVNPNPGWVGCTSVHFKLDYNSNGKISGIEHKYNVVRNAPDAPYLKRTEYFPFVYSKNELIRIGDTSVSIIRDSAGKVNSVQLGNSYLVYDTLHNLISWTSGGINFDITYDNTQANPFQGYPFEFALFLFIYQPLGHRCEWISLHEFNPSRTPHSIWVFFNFHGGPYMIKKWKTRDSTSYNQNSEWFTIEGNVQKSILPNGDWDLKIEEIRISNSGFPPQISEYTFEINF